MEIGNAEIEFACGKRMKNCFMLAPLTNCQSHEDGTLSDNEFHWLTMRAKGQFGMTMTCAAHVQAVGQGFPGQLGIFSDRHLEGHKRLAAAIQTEHSLAVAQLHHAGMRSPSDLIGTEPVCPSADEETGSRALTLDEVHTLRDDFIAAAVRAQQSGYDGVEVHGAHGYVICQFLSETYNRRDDQYGGALENRARLLFEIVSGIRAACGDGFLIGVRLSPERFGMRLTEALTVCQQLIDGGETDFLDISLWDSFKLPVEEEFQDKSLLAHFADLPRGNVRLTVAGKIMSAENVRDVLAGGIDFVAIGRGAILHHDYPQKVMADAQFEPVALPVSRAHLNKEGLSETFVQYMHNWKGFVAD